MVFTERTSAPEKDNFYYNSNQNIYYNAGLPMPNCTTYAWGRLWEETGIIPKIGVLNATDWFNEAQRIGLEVGNTPKLGAIICWAGAGTNPYGHVGVVEEIYSDGSVLVSESAWHGIYWNNGLIASPDNNYMHPTSPNAYPCQGFIYANFSNENDELIIRKDYIDILERNADVDGLNAYLNAFKGGFTEEQLKQELLNSQENIYDLSKCHKYWFIVRCYKCILGRFPENEIVIENRLDSTKEEIFNEIWFSEEAKNIRKQ